MKEQVGESIRALRKKRGLKQWELANAIKMREGQLSRYERGIAEPRIEALVRIAKGLGVTLDQLVLG
jgi:transcriptional regulator with XRE-family HTH domain